MVYTVYVTNRSSGWKQETVYWCSNTNKQFFGMKYIELTQGKRAMVDDEDYEELSKFKWCALKKGNGFRVVRKQSKKGGLIYMHRFIINPPSKKEVDHKNGNQLDNRKRNLRICSRSENNMNRRKPSNNKSGYKGVIFDRNKWRSCIMANKKRKELGRFDTAIEAYKAYVEACTKYHGDFANLG